MNEYVKRFRRMQTVVSIVIFVAIFLFCWWSTKFKITDIQLSYWGVEEKLGPLWNISIMLMSISIYINAAFFLQHHKRLLYFRSFYWWFAIVSLLLFIVGFVPMHNRLHDITAALYFFLYPLVIFCLAHLNRKHMLYREWVGHVAISVSMVLAPAILLHFFKGMAISEAIHTTIVILWNIWLLRDTNNTEA